ncbi:hypothetical protein BKA57DRAFT_444133 [Linnemannia elongata]|nr:hypothetical protein BKA57DRAFT_444133 [Linnemannia elongata]
MLAAIHSPFALAFSLFFSVNQVSSPFLFLLLANLLYVVSSSIQSINRKLPLPCCAFHGFQINIFFLFFPAPEY